MIEFRLRLRFIQDDLQAEITAKKTISEKDFDPLKTIITKAREKEVDLTPVAKFLKNEDVNNLLKNGWKLDDVEFILSADDMFSYYERQKDEGGTIRHAHDTMFPHVSIPEIHVANFQLIMNNKIASCAMKGIRGGHILPQYRENHDKKLKDKCSNIDNYIKKSTKITNVIERPKKITLSKSEGKRCRKSVIDKATISDICKGGFKPEFIKTLDINEQSYLESLSNLQIKFMMNAVTKK